MMGARLRGLQFEGLDLLVAAFFLLVVVVGVIFPVF